MGSEAKEGPLEFRSVYSRDLTRRALGREGEPATLIFD